MLLRGVESDQQLSLIPLYDYIGKAVRFEYFSREGGLVNQEGIFRRVTPYGVYISLFNPLVPIKLRGVTVSEGLEKYFPFSGEEALIRVVQSKTREFVNTFENVWGEVEDIIAL